MENQKKKVYPILLGCDKNRVDLEKMLYSIKSNGYEIVNDISGSNIVIIQTCAFILPARQEAIQNILECIELKNKGLVEKIIVSGCFPQKHLEELQAEFKEVDAFVLIKDYPIIANIINNLYDIHTKTISQNDYKRYITTPSHYAYLKIADGCDNCCAYCTIPRIRGRYKSIPIDNIIKEAEELVKNGAKELILVAQDTTRYGIDLYGEPKLLELLSQITKIKNLEWVRLHYSYPEMVSDELLQFIMSNDKMCKYLDIPLQHIDDNILKNMNRKSSEESIISLVNKIRTKYSNIKIRTTFIVGFPGEKSSSFKKLIRFLNTYKLDMVGFFSYSREEKTKAFFMKNQVPKIVKLLRLKKAQKVQDKIFILNSNRYLGNTYKCIVDDFDEMDNTYLGRFEYSSPDVDFVIKIINNNNINIGEFYNIKINSFSNGIFYGEVVNEYTK